MKKNNIYRLSVRLNLEDSRDKEVYDLLVKQPNMNRFIIENILAAQNNKEVLNAIMLLHGDVKAIKESIEDSSSDFKQLTI